MTSGPAIAPSAPVTPVNPGRSGDRGALSGAWLLSGATLASGVLAYAFHILAARTLSADGYGRIAVLWGAMFLVAIVLFRPIEQTASRTIADRLARGWETRSVVVSATIVALAALAIGTVLMLALWEPITSGLFDGDGTLTLMLVAGVVTYGLSYVVRGLLGGVRWFAGYGLNLVFDGAARLFVALPLIVVASTGLAAAAMVAAGLAGAAIPLWVGRRRLRVLRDRGPGERFRPASTLAFAAPAAVIAGADQIVVNSSPVLVVLAGGTAATAGVVFAATMLVRIPVYVFQGVAASILPNLTRLHATDDTSAFRSAVWRTVAILIGLAGILAVGAMAIGPHALRIVYGPEFDAGRAELGLLGVGVGLYLAASTVSQALLAQDRGPAAAMAWATAAVLFVGAFFVLPGSELMRIAVAFAVSMAVGAAIVAAFLLRRDTALPRGLAVAPHPLPER